MSCEGCPFRDECSPLMKKQCEYEESRQPKRARQ